MVKLIRGLETGVLVLLLSSMLGLAAYQVLARNFFDGGILWGDAAVRVMVLWGALLGAMVAARADEHIRIDLLTRYASPGVALWMRRLTGAFTAVVCGLVAYYSGIFVIDERSYGEVAFAEVPAWICQAIIPVGMGLISLRYVGHTISPPPLQQPVSDLSGESQKESGDDSGIAK